jgi:DNA-binding MarR family transcriptional regulator
LSTDKTAAATPLQIGALLRFALHEIRSCIYEGVVSAGFDDVRPSHVTLFRWPGPDGRRPTEVAADAQISKQRVNDLLRDLERLGYLRLEPDPDDSRARVIRLTARGKRLHRVAIDAHAAVEVRWAISLGRRRYRDLYAALKDVVMIPSQGDVRVESGKAFARLSR